MNGSAGPRTVPRSLVVAIAAILLILPGSVALAAIYRSDANWDVLHWHTDKYGVKTSAEIEDAPNQDLKNGIANARDDWRDGLSDRGAALKVKAFIPSSGDQSPEIRFEKEAMGGSNVLTITSLPGHPTATAPGEDDPAS